ncbi:galactose-3-O-sulfotransferase 2 isoform X2 [Hydra vulgaris]|uniref:galactose-3-O-sulfotransferase 2 isoform X2 n=1 Tax=Hydra vulgaris TaxID=6087 RepID=UPI001F5F8DEC|nr:galactose-3-O-sulfotransferase 2-like isoform X2 [Hydra vulgaris]
MINTKGVIKISFQRKRKMNFSVSIRDLRYPYSCMCKCKLLASKKIIFVLLFWSLTIFIYHQNKNVTILFKREIIFSYKSNPITQHINIETDFATRVNISKKIQSNVIFLKTHKTGSSTITNIMQRYSKSNKLNVALPQCDHRFCYPEKFDENFLFLHKKDEIYNMLFNHAVFDKEKMLKIMNPDTKIITIIRDPYSQFDSAAQYLEYKKYFNLSENLPLLDEFFKIPEFSLKQFLQSIDLKSAGGVFALAKNPNAFDLGFDIWNETPEYINKVLHSISQNIHLVMIMEYMEESLVMLKNEFSWELEDVVFYVHNARKLKDKNTNDINDATKKVLNWNKLDAAIYKHFNETFWMKIKTSPPGFDEDVKKLKEWNTDLQSFCNFYKVTETSKRLLANYERKSGENLCKDISMEDVQFTNWFKNMRFYKLARLRKL